MRDKAKSTLEEGVLEKLIFLLKEKNEKVEWEESGKEFRYKDKMYDIVKIEIHQDSVIYFCLHDRDEETLLSNFDKLIKNSLGNNGKSKNNSVKELSKYNFNHINNIYISVKKINFYPLRPLFYRSITIKIQPPPPKIV